MDPEIYRDQAFNDGLTLDARYAYVASLFYLASGPGPEGVYPFSRVAAELGDATESAAGQLLAFNLWSVAGPGYQVWPYCGWRVIPEKRVAIPEAVRHAVFERDGHVCVTCGATADLSLDHIYPWSLGGPDTFDNLQTLCSPCNSSKGARV